MVAVLPTVARLLTTGTLQRSVLGRQVVGKALFNAVGALSIPSQTFRPVKLRDCTCAAPSEAVQGSPAAKAVVARRHKFSLALSDNFARAESCADLLAEVRRALDYDALTTSAPISLALYRLAADCDVRTDEVDDVVVQLAQAALRCADKFEARHLATTLWALSELHAPASCLQPLLAATLGSHAAYTKREHLLQYWPLEDLGLLVNTFAALAASGFRAEPATVQFVEDIAADVAERMGSASELWGGSLAILSQFVCSYGELHALHWGHLPHSPTAQSEPHPARPCSRAVAQLCDVIAIRLRKHLMNKHSQAAGHLQWRPRQLVALVHGYSLLHHYNGHVAGMLDEVAKLAKREVHRPGDLAMLLRAFAALDHRTVAVLDLLGATSAKVKSKLADQISMQPPESAGPSGYSHADHGMADHIFDERSPDQPTFASDIAATLQAFRSLGYSPGPTMLHAATPVLCRQRHDLSAQDAAAVLEAFAAFGQPAGPLLETAMLSRMDVEDGRPGSGA